MKLFNSLTRRLEDFEPNAAVAKIYSCGPTVYDFAHIGNLRAFIFADTLRRVVEASGYQVRQVINITDVGHLASDGDEGQDKLETGAVREGKTVWEVAEQYTKAFLADVKALNILPPNGYKGSPDGYARATHFIDTQVAIVKLLLDKGYGYQTEQAIYFDVTKLKDYGKLTGQKLTDKEVAARREVVEDSHKKHPYDFAVWFFTVGRFKDHVMHWDTPWGSGFPGWHLECSAIIHETLGEPIDIHTGGVDHIGTHHTNEIAQTEAAFGQELAHFWLHNEFVLVDGIKMSKSLGNFYTLKDITDKGFDPLAFRLLVLSAHYRSPLNFTWQSLEGAGQSLGNFYQWADLQFQAQTSEALKSNYLAAQTAFQRELGNDLNTPKALAILNSMITSVDQLGADSEAITEAIVLIEKAFGLNLDKRRDVAADQRELLTQRQAARNQQDWKTADKLRESLKQAGLTVRDTEQGQLWSRD
ncbi:cysteine--tRNA ligase [Candidatus Saccharibacteria bacterium]|nr:cysteine--tRNA ligase [Candidatus Saccharibacteria bacterium]